MNKECQEMLNEVRELFNQPRKAIKIGRAMLAKGKEYKDYEAIAHGHYIIGSAMFVSGKEESIMAHATRAVALFREQSDKTMLVRSLNLQGIAYTATEEYQMALMTYQEAYEMAQTFEKNRYRKDIILSNIAISYFSIGDARRAIKILERLYRRMGKYIEDESFCFSTVYNLADICCEIGELDRALEYALECEAFLEESGNDIPRLMQTVVTTKLYYLLGNVEQGNLWSDKVVALIKQGVDSFELHRDYEKIVLLQLDAGEYDRADDYANFMWDEAQKTNNSLDMLRAARMQARYFDLQDNTRMALYYYRMMDKINEKRNQEILHSQLNIARNNESLVKQMKNYQKAMQEKEKLEILASKDALTGLLNRNALSRMIEQYVEFSQKEGKAVGSIFLDVDYFKEYNDTYGHLKGDECLKSIADACLAAQDDRIHFIRYGGDEFFGIGYGLTNDEIQEKALQIVEQIKENNVAHKASKVLDRVSVSVGVLNIPMDESNNILDVVNFSDRALYYSKEHGRNCVHMFDEAFFKAKNDMRFIPVE